MLLDAIKWNNIYKSKMTDSDKDSNECQFSSND